VNWRKRAIELSAERLFDTSDVPGPLPVSVCMRNETPSHQGLVAAGWARPDNVDVNEPCGATKAAERLRVRRPPVCRVVV
jgi:hypothetical protein